MVLEATFVAAIAVASSLSCPTSKAPDNGAVLTEAPPLLGDFQCEHWSGHISSSHMSESSPPMSHSLATP